MAPDLLCAADGCERRWVRTRDGQRYCFWHPDSEPVTAEQLKKIEDVARRAKPRKQAVAPAERPSYRAPGRVADPAPVVEVPAPRATEPDVDDMAELQAELDELERTDPVVAAAAVSYDAAVDRVLARPAEAVPGELDQGDSTLPAVVPSVAGERLPDADLGVDATLDVQQEEARDREDVPRAGSAGDGPDPVEGPRSEERPDPPARRDDGRAPLPWAESAPAVATEPTPSLARLQAALERSVAALQEALAAIAEVHGTRPATSVARRPGRRPRPFDEARARELYADGHTVTEVAHELGVRRDRVTELLRASGELRPQGPRPAGGRTAAQVDEAEAVRRYTAGERLFDLAKDLGIGAKRLRTILQAHDVRIRGRGEVVGRRGVEPRPFDADEAVRLYESGLDYAQVARHLGVKGSRVADVLRARGVLRRPIAQATPLDEDRARALYAQGASLGEVARELAVRTSRVADVLRAHGELRPQGQHRARSQVAS